MQRNHWIGLLLGLLIGALVPGISFYYDVVNSTPPPNWLNWMLVAMGAALLAVAARLALLVWRDRKASNDSKTR